MASSAFDASWSVAAVKAGMVETLAGEALGRVVGFEGFDFNSHKEERSFDVNLFAGRGGGKND